MGGNSSLEELYLDETSVASLEGIERARNLRVLHMHRVSLDGQSIPEEFYDLTYLSIFALSESGVTGTISSNIGKLTNLQSILLHGNDLTGTIPAEIGLLTQLEDLFLTDNKMFGTLPSEMSLLTSLRDIFLDNRNRRGAGFSGPLPSFYNMPKLRDLHLASNSITGQIPRDLFAGVDDKSAEINCDISSNFLTGAIPSQLSAFGDLNLDVTDNEITSIEDGLCSQASSWFGGSLGSYGCNGLLCPAGTYNAQGRQSSENTPCVVCSGENVPPYLGQTSCLSDERKKEREILKIFFEATNGQKWKNNAGWLQTDNYCQWYGITCVDDGSTVESISLGSNNLVGKIPSEIYDLSDLSDLILYSNPIEFSFDGIYKASNLENLRLDSTGLKSLDGIGEARGLKSIDVRFNNLRGQLPSLDNLESLEVLSLSSNKLIGPLPSFAQNRKLVSLRAGSNMFSGSVPSFSNHPNMRTLDLAANSLSGSIPEDILDEVDSSAEFFLDLSSNELTGGVPRSLSRFQDLTLYLRDNQIEDLHSDLCSQNDWNEGDVGLFQCDGILCPPNTFSPGTGRASRGGSDCQKCDSSKYFGATTCGASSGGSPSVVYSMGLFSVLLSTIPLAYL